MPNLKKNKLNSEDLENQKIEENSTEENPQKEEGEEPELNKEKNNQEELDFGIKSREESSEEESPEEDKEEPPKDKATLLEESDLKPDFKSVATIFLKMDESKSMEDLQLVQNEYEKFLQETLVPKIEKALGMIKSGETKKAGVSDTLTNKPTERITTSLKNRK